MFPLYGQSYTNCPLFKFNLFSSVISLYLFSSFYRSLLVIAFFFTYFSLPIFLSLFFSSLFQHSALLKFPSINISVKASCLRFEQLPSTDIPGHVTMLVWLIMIFPHIFVDRWQYLIDYEKKIKNLVTHLSLLAGLLRLCEILKKAMGLPQQLDKSRPPFLFPWQNKTLRWLLTVTDYFFILKKTILCRQESHAEFNEHWPWWFCARSTSHQWRRPRCPHPCHEDFSF